MCAATTQGVTSERLPVPRNSALNEEVIHEISQPHVCPVTASKLADITLADVEHDSATGKEGIFTSPPLGGGRGIVMPMSVCVFVCVFVCLCVCPCFRKISKCNISVISQPIIMKLNIHIEYGYSVTDKYFQNFRSKVKVVGHRNVFP